MDPFILESLIATGTAGLGIAAARRASANRRPARPPMPRLMIAALPHRHRRAARAIADRARAYLGRHPDGSLETFTARETLRSYLPETVAAYLAVPPGSRRKRRSGALSADDEFRRQLLTLRAGLDRLFQAEADIGAARMAENGAFLNERFGAPPEAIAKPASVASSVDEFVRVLAAYLHRA